MEVILVQCLILRGRLRLKEMVMARLYSFCCAIALRVGTLCFEGEWMAGSYKEKAGRGCPVE